MPGRGLFWVFWFLLAVWPHQGGAFLGKGVISAGRRGSGAKTGRHKDPVAPVAEAWGVSHGRSGSSGIMHFPPGKFGLHSMPSGDFDGASSSGSSGRRSKNRMQEDVPGDMEVRRDRCSPRRQKNPDGAMGIRIDAGVMHRACSPNLPYNYCCCCILQLVTVVVVNRDNLKKELLKPAILITALPPSFSETRSTGHSLSIYIPTQQLAVYLLQQQ